MIPPHEYGRAFYDGLLKALLRMMEDAHDEAPESLENGGGAPDRESVEDLLPPDARSLDGERLLEVFGSLIDAKDRYTGGHSRRVAELSGVTARALELEEDVRDTLRAAGYLHDLGKVKVPCRLLVKRGSLTPAEREEVELHASQGALVLEVTPGLRHLAPVVRHHHERWDGRGYPEGLARDRIPLAAQVLAVCDTYDAITSTRAYRPARSHDEALDEIRAGSGSQFGPRVAEAFVSLPSETFREIRGREAPVRAAFFQSLFPPAELHRRASGDRGS